MQTSSVEIGPDAFALQSIAIARAFLFDSNVLEGTTPVVRAEAESTPVSALAVFFPSNEVFVFYELRESIGKTGLLGWSTI